jgi:hypothetical protein
MTNVSTQATPETGTVAFQGNPLKHTSADKALFGQYADYFERSTIPTTLKLQNFAKYVRRQDLSRFLAKNELFRLQVDVPGVVIECGCFAGGGLLTWAQLSSIYEPYNHQRRVYGFDTFSGFPSVDARDANRESSARSGDLFVDRGITDELGEAIALHDSNRALNHIPKTELVVGDAMVTIPRFLQDNPHLVVSLLYLDFDLHAPTRLALETFGARMPRGAVLAFDELNTRAYPGETLALLETLGIRSLRLRKTPFDPYIAYAVLE